MKAIFKIRIRDLIRIYILLLPTIIIVALLRYIPAAAMVKYSFYRWDGIYIEEFRGLENYINLFLHDPIFWKSFRLVGILILCNTIKMLPAMLVAVLIHHLRSKSWQYIYTALFTLPLVIPGIVILLIWKSFYDPITGIINDILNKTGLMELLAWLDVNLLGWNAFVDKTPAWLSHPKLVIPAVVFWGFPWISSASFLIYLSGLKNIPEQMYELGRLDGLNFYKTFYYIELPYIKTQIHLNMILLIIGTITDYYIFLLLLGPEGGPSNIGMVPGLYMFYEGIYNQRYGYASTMGVVIFLIIVLATILLKKSIKIENY